MSDTLERCPWVSICCLFVCLFFGISITKCNVTIIQIISEICTICYKNTLQYYKLITIKTKKIAGVYDCEPMMIDGLYNLISLRECRGSWRGPIAFTYIRCTRTSYRVEKWKSKYIFIIFHLITILSSCIDMLNNHPFENMSA